MTNEKIDAIIAYFNENEDIFNECMEELDNYNGYLGDDRYYCMEELDDFYCGTKAIEILERAFFGYDAETWTLDDSGNKEYGAFNPNRDYFRVNAYGNLISANYKDYSAFNGKYTVVDMNENKERIDAIDCNDELKALFDALDENEDESEKGAY